MSKAKNKVKQKPTTLSRVGRVDGFSWLLRHHRRSDVVSFVTGPGSAVPAWMRDDPNFDKIERDRKIWQAMRNPPAGVRKPGLRPVAAAHGVSYQMVKNVLDAYADASKVKTDGPVKPVERLKLKKAARSYITRQVLKDYDAGVLTAQQIAKHLDPAADHRNAVYWVERMRTLFSRQDKSEKKGSREQAK